MQFNKEIDFFKFCDSRREMHAVLHFTLKYRFNCFLDPYVRNNLSNF